MYAMLAMLSHSTVSNSVTAWTVGCRASLSMGILQAKILEWVAMPSSRGSSQPRDRTHFPRIAGRCFNLWATRGVLKMRPLLPKVRPSGVGLPETPGSYDFCWETSDVSSWASFLNLIRLLWDSNENTDVFFQSVFIAMAHNIRYC